MNKKNEINRIKVDVYIYIKCSFCSSQKLCLVMSNGKQKMYLCQQKKCKQIFDSKFYKDNR